MFASFFQSRASVPIQVREKLASFAWQRQPLCKRLSDVTIEFMGNLTEPGFTAELDDKRDPRSNLAKRIHYNQQYLRLLEVMLRIETGCSALALPLPGSDVFFSGSCDTGGATDPKVDAILQITRFWGDTTSEWVSAIREHVEQSPTAQTRDDNHTYSLLFYALSNYREARLSPSIGNLLGAAVGLRTLSNPSHVKFREGGVPVLSESLLALMDRRRYSPSDLFRPLFAAITLGAVTLLGEVNLMSHKLTLEQMGVYADHCGSHKPNPALKYMEDVITKLLIDLAFPDSVSSLWDQQRCFDLCVNRIETAWEQLSPFVRNDVLSPDPVTRHTGSASELEERRFGHPRLDRPDHLLEHAGASEIEDPVGYAHDERRSDHEDVSGASRSVHRDTRSSSSVSSGSHESNTISKRKRGAASEMEDPVEYAYDDTTSVHGELSRAPRSVHRDTRSPSRASSGSRESNTSSKRKRDADGSDDAQGMQRPKATLYKKQRGSGYGAEYPRKIAATSKPAALDPRKDFFQSNKRVLTVRTPQDPLQCYEIEFLGVRYQMPARRGMEQLVHEVIWLSTHSTYALAEGNNSSLYEVGIAELTFDSPYMLGKFSTSHIIMRHTDVPDGMMWSEPVLGYLQHLDQKLNVHDMSTYGCKPGNSATCLSSLREMFACGQAIADGAILSTQIMPRAGGLISAPIGLPLLASDEMAWNSTTEYKASRNLSHPANFSSWVMVKLKGSWSKRSQAYGGLSAYVKVLVGKLLWFYTADAACLSKVDQRQYNDVGPSSDFDHWRCMLLEPGDIMYTRPGTISCHLALEHCIMQGGTFVAVGQLDQMLLTQEVQARRGDKLTIDCHPLMLTLLYRLVMYVEYVLYLSDLQPDCIKSGVPDRTKHSNFHVPWDMQELGALLIMVLEDTRLEVKVSLEQANDRTKQRSAFLGFKEHRDQAQRSAGWLANNIWGGNVEVVKTWLIDNRAAPN